MRRHLPLLLLALAFLLPALPSATHAQNVFTVNTVGDASDADRSDGTCATSNGDCTLRAAIQQANSTSNAAAGPDRIAFDFSTSPPYIFFPTRPLPSITDPLVIDGTSEPDYPDSGTNGPVVQIDGDLLSGNLSEGDLLRINAPNSAVKGLSLVNARDEALEVTADGASITDCFVGLGLDGTTERGNSRRPTGDAAALVVDANNATISQNVISGNDFNGVLVAGDNATLSENTIGLNAAGDAKRSNAGTGVVVTGNGNAIGKTMTTLNGSGVKRGNVISGNGVNGVVVAGDNNNVFANLIGTTSSGSSPVGNDKTGVVIAGTSGDAAENNVIGGPNEVDGNVISGNTRQGITLGVASTDEAARGTTIRNNTIGLNEAEDASLPNGNTSTLTAGIFIGLANSTSSNDTQIAQNTIAGNEGLGIFIFEDTRNVAIDILDNVIGTNSSFATGLGNSGDGVEVKPNPSSFTSGDQIQIVDNVIGSNGVHGVEITGSFHGVYNNYVGVAPNASNTNLANGGGDKAGIRLDNGSANLNGVIVGGSSASSIPGDGSAAGNATPNGTGNVIGYQEDGILVQGAAINVAIKENYVGTNPDGDDIGNAGIGVSIVGDGSSSTGHSIGYNYGRTISAPHPADGGEGNVIRFNAGLGVRIGDPSETQDVRGASIRGNVIRDNADDVELGATGPENDNGSEDADTGPNNLQNVPVINSVTYDSNTDEVTIDYTVFSSTQNADYGHDNLSEDGLKVDFYATGGAGGAQTYLDTQLYDTPSQPEQVMIDLSTVSGVNPSDNFVATVTDASGNTSQLTDMANQLPVELTSFEARQSDEGSVRLTWKTTSETNNAGFRVQHRTGETEGWQKLGVVSSRADGGTTSEAQAYRFTAEGLSVGMHQFRLTQVDVDGTTTVYDPVTVDLEMQQAVRLDAPTPNPMQQRASVSFAVREPVPTTVQLYNVLGQRVETLYRGTPTAGDEQDVTLSASDLAGGVYFLRLRAQDQTRVEKVTVAR